MESSVKIDDDDDAIDEDDDGSVWVMVGQKVRMMLKTMVPTSEIERLPQTRQGPRIYIPGHCTRWWRNRSLV